MSDGWEAHASIEKLGEGNHSVAVHKQNFVRLNHWKVHTEIVENMRMRAKCILRGLN